MPATAAAAPEITEHLTGAPGTNGVARGADGDTYATVTDNPGEIARLTPGGALTRYVGGVTPGFTDGGKPVGITAGPGGMWATQSSKNKIVRLDGNGAITEFPLGSAGKPGGITLGPDGNIWYAAAGNKGAVGRLTPAGAVSEFTLGLTENGGPKDIAVGPDGALWFTEPLVNRVGRITVQGVISEFATGVAGGVPNEIVAGPDGNLWFTLGGPAPAIVRMTPAGVVTHFTAGLPLNSAPEGITVGGDGNLHFTDNGANAIGTITTNGAISMTSAGLTAAANLRGIVSGSDGALWFAEYRGAIGRMTVAPYADRIRTSRLTSDSVTLSADATPNSQATTAYYEWGTTTAYGQQTADVALAAGGAAQDVDATLTGLAPSTTYHARLVTTNSTGTHRGPDRAFTTTAVNAPSATTDDASAVGAASATLNGTINPNGNATTYRFEWGTSAAYGSSIPVPAASAGADGADHAVAEALEGLAPNTTYHYRVVATSSVDVTYGDDVAFTTDAAVPDVAAPDAIGITSTSAKLIGSINPRNSETAYRFEWGRDAAYGNVAPALDAVVGDDNGSHGVLQSLEDLEPNTTYHFRLVATNASGTVASADRTFTTAPTTPLVATSRATDVVSDAATLHGIVEPRNATTRTWFEWGTSPAYGHVTRTLEIGPDDVPARELAERVSGLAPDTTYHFRAVAESAGGITRGADRAFTTGGLPPVVTPAGSPAAPTTPATNEPPAGTIDVPGFSSPLPAPRFGGAVTAGVVRGDIRLRRPGRRGFEALDDSSRIPNGTVVDARRGALLIVSALDAAGRTQHATFRGARFKVRQLAAADGIVDLVLRERAAGCRRAPVAAAAAKRRRKRSRGLWGRDDGGRYRTHGRNSVATVRGTQWLTRETCAGTRTTVREGAVSVRDRRSGRRVLLTAGRSYLARRRPAR